MNKFFHIVSLYILIVVPIFATTINIPADFPTIQEGIHASADGDTVLVSDGIYYENLSINREITLASHFIIDGDISHRYETIIDGSNYDEDSGPFGSCVLFRPSENGEPISPKLTGFTIQNGQGTRVRESVNYNVYGPTFIKYYMGGGLMIDHCLPEITYNLIKNNGGDLDTRGARARRGGGAGLNNSDDVEFDEDRSESYERTVLTRDDEIIFSNNIFENNDSETGNTFESISYLGDIDLSDSFFDVFASDDEDVSDYWIVTDSATVDFTGGLGVEEAITQDIYLSPNGSDDNDGLTTETPFQHIDFALQRVYGNEENPAIINLLEGVYSPTTTNDIFPKRMISNVKLIGSGEESTILDADSTATVIVLDKISNVTLESLTIRNGHAPGEYGSSGEAGANWAGGGIFSNYSSYITLKDVTIRDNSADAFAGIHFWVGINFYLTNVTIRDNIAKVSGGAGSIASASNYPAYDWDSEELLTNILITGNRATNENSHVGGIFFFFCNPILKNVTISDNTAAVRSGGLSLMGSNPILVNTIIWDNSPDLIEFYLPENFPFPSNATITYSNIQGDTTWAGDGNINLDPLFTDPDNGDFSLQEDSPCIDTGTADLDGDGVDDINDYYGSAPDMGALEYGVLSIDYDTRIVPDSFTLHQNFPNPFNPITTLRYNLSSDAFVALTVFDMLGKEITQLVNTSQQAGLKSVQWNATDSMGRSVSAGVYLYQIKVGEFVEIKKMVLLK